MSLYGDLASGVREREFWAYTVWLEIITRYRRMRLGAFWLLAPPVAYVLGLGYLYAHVMGRDPAYFIPHLGFGYILWRLAIQVISESADVFSMHQAFIMDGRTRLTDYIMRTFAKSSLYFAIGFCVILVVLLVDPLIPKAWLPSLILTIPVYVVNLGWMATIVALIGARHRDTREVINTGLIFGFLLTPIIWDAALVPADTARGIVARFNPFFHLIEFVRAPIFGHLPETTTLVVVAAMTVVGWVLAAFLYRRYSRFVPLWI